MLCTVGEMAKELGVAPSTLRYYDKEGLLPFVERSGGGIRVFQDKDRAALAVIECLKRTGLSIKEIKAFMDWCQEGDATIGQRLELMERQREAVKAQIAQMQDTLALLEYKCWYYETAKQAGTCAGLEHLKKEDVPAPMRPAWEKAHSTGEL